MPVVSIPRIGLEQPSPRIPSRANMAFEQPIKERARETHHLGHSMITGGDDLPVVPQYMHRYLASLELGPVVLPAYTNSKVPKGRNTTNCAPWTQRPLIYIADRLSQIG